MLEALTSGLSYNIFPFLSLGKSLHSHLKFPSRGEGLFLVSSAAFLRVTVYYLALINGVKSQRLSRHITGCNYTPLLTVNTRRKEADNEV